MNTNNNNLKVKIPESTIRAMEEAQESYKRLSENIANLIPKLPKIDIPKFQLPEIKTLCMMRYIGNTLKVKKYVDSR